MRVFMKKIILFFAFCNARKQMVKRKNVINIFNKFVLIKYFFLYSYALIIFIISY